MKADAQASGRPLAAKFLVTGAAGFIGRHLCSRLCALNVEVLPPHIAIIPRCRSAGLVAGGPVGPSCRSPRILRRQTRHRGSSRGSTGAGAGDLVLPTYRSLATSTVNVLMQVSEWMPPVILVGSLNEPDWGVKAPIPGCRTLPQSGLARPTAGCFTRSTTLR